MGKDGERGPGVAILVATGLGLALGLLILAGRLAWGQDMPPMPMQGHMQGHMRYHAEYMWWKQPHSEASCCNARVVYPNGSFIGDCYPTKFELTKAGWRAKLAPEDGKGDGDGWVTVPDSKIIHEKNPDPTGISGHLCYSYGRVLCAVPPAGTM